MASSLEQADREELIRALTEKRPVPSDVARRVRDRADAVRQNILRKHGVQNIGVDLIRELRDTR